MMNIKEAAEYLGISVKTLERKIAGGDIAVAYTSGATGKQRTFDQGELDRFKSDEAARVAATSYVARPRVAPVASDAASTQQSLQMAFQAQDIAPLGKRLIAALEGLQAVTAAQHGNNSSVPVGDKLVLSLKEVSLLTGRSVARLREDCESGRLKAKKNEIARGWRVKRDDLESYVRKL